MGVNRVTVRKADVNIKALMIALDNAKPVKVGYPEETTGPEIHKEADVPLATLASWHEYGDADSPPRPFMRQGLDRTVKQRGLMVPHVKRLVSGRTHVDRFMIAMGMLLKAGIEGAVAEQNFAPLSRATIARKGSTEILIDSSQMVDGLDVHLDR